MVKSDPFYGELYRRAVEGLGLRMERCDGHPIGEVAAVFE